MSMWDYFIELKIPRERLLNWEAKAIRENRKTWKGGRHRCIKMEWAILKKMESLVSV